MAFAKSMFLVTQLLTFTLGFIGVFGVIVALFSGLNLVTDFVPIEGLYFLGAYTALVLLVSFIGLGTVFCGCDQFFCCFVLISGLQIVLNLTVLIAFILFKQGIGTFAIFDELLDETITNFEADLPSIASQNEDGFFALQNELNCCGLDLETAFDVNGTDFLTGDECFEEIQVEDGTKTGFEVIVDLITEFGEGNFSAAQIAAEEDPILSDGDFFCLPILIEIRDLVIFWAIVIMGIVLVFEFIAFICSCGINRYVERDEEGNLDFEHGGEQFNNIVIKVSTRAKLPFVKVKDGFVGVVEPIRKRTLNSTSTATLKTRNESNGGFDSFGDEAGEELSPIERQEYFAKRKGSTDFIAGSSKWGSSARFLIPQMPSREGFMSLIAPFSSNRGISRMNDEPAPPASPTLPAHLKGAKEPSQTFEQYENEAAKIGKSDDGA